MESKIEQVSGCNQMSRLPATFIAIIMFITSNYEVYFMVHDKILLILSLMVFWRTLRKSSVSCTCENKTRFKLYYIIMSLNVLCYIF